MYCLSKFNIVLTLCILLYAFQFNVRLENKIKERIFVEFDNYGLKYADSSVRNKLFFFSNDHAERVFHKLLVI